MSVTNADTSPGGAGQSAASDTADGLTAVGSDAAKRILAAAVALFAERGFEGASMRDVALRADVSKANVFHHFGTKAGLYDAVLALAGRTFQQQHDVLRDRSLTLPESIEAFASVNLQQMLDSPDMISLFMRQLLNASSRPEQADPQRAGAENVIGRGLNDLVGILSERLNEVRGDAPIDGPPCHDAFGLALILLGGGFAYFQLRHVIERRSGVPLSQFDVGDYSRSLLKLLRPGLETERDTSAPA